MKNRPLKDFIKGRFYDSFADCGNIEVIGDRRVIVEGARSVIEYESGRVLVGALKYTLSVTGADLTIESYNDDVMIVEGNIKTISFL